VVGRSGSWRRVALRFPGWEILGTGVDGWPVRGDEMDGIWEEEIMVCNL
jgi:hypothetical protein